MNGRVAGLDGCRGGWVAAVHDLCSGRLHLHRLAHVGELFAHHRALAAVAIDMPIGLPERAGPGGRAPERAVRRLLGQRQSSVFSIPSRSAVEAALDPAVPEAERYRNCCTLARATSAEGKAVARQGFAIFPKILELDAWLRAHPETAGRVHECHPEVAFWAMNGETPVPHPKKVKGRAWPQGLDFRRELLRRHGFAPDTLTAATARALGVGEDDLIDAHAACWTAARIAREEARSFPAAPERDPHGLAIAIWV